MTLPSMSPLDNHLLFTCLFETDEIHCLGPALDSQDISKMEMVYLIQKPAKILTGDDNQYIRKVKIIDNFSSQSIVPVPEVMIVN